MWNDLDNRAFRSTISSFCYRFFGFFYRVESNNISLGRFGLAAGLLALTAVFCRPLFFLICTFWFMNSADLISFPFFHCFPLTERQLRNRVFGACDKLLWGTSVGHVKCEFSSGLG